MKRRKKPTGGRKSDRTPFVRFWKKYLRLTRGRVPVLRALAVIGDEEPDLAFRERIVSIRRAVDGGATLSEAIQPFAEFFSLSVVELVRTAEKTGAWDEILQEITDGLEDGTFD